MALSRFPAYLTLMRRGEDPQCAHTCDEKPVALPETLRPSQRDRLSGVATRQALLERLEAIGELAPAASLSFVVVRVEGVALVNRMCGPDQGDEMLKAVAGLITKYTRATDMVGRLSGASFGIILQGAGPTGAAAAAARLSHHLGQLYSGGTRVDARVTVASGRGINADVLPAAATGALDDCG